MEQLRSLSIDPYINKGGILGKNLTVNEIAAHTVMQKAAFKKDIFVTRIDEENASYSSQGSDELTLAKIGSAFLRLKGEDISQRSTLKSTPTGWLIEVQDQGLHKDTDKKMRDVYKIQTGIIGNYEYKKEFVKRLNKEVAKGVDKASLHEKKERFLSTLGLSVFHDTILAGSMAAMYFGGKWMGEIAIDVVQDYYRYKDEWYPDPRPELLIASGALLTFGASATAIQLIYSQESRNQFHVWEKFIPNPGLRTLTQGKLALHKHGKNLIQLNQD